MNKLLWTKQLTPRQGTKTLLCQASAFASPLETTYAPSGDENHTAAQHFDVSDAKQLTPRQGTKTLHAAQKLPSQALRNNLRPVRGRKRGLNVLLVV